MSRVAVIGGGPAGIMAAAAAAGCGHDSVLLEKNEKLGKKLFITGKGRCNITNSCDTDDFFANIPRNPKFLYSALYGFSNTDIVELINANGVPTKVEDRKGQARLSRIGQVQRRYKGAYAAFEQQRSGTQAQYRGIRHTKGRQRLRAYGKRMPGGI